MHTSRVRAYLQLILVVVIWGVAPAVIKFALGEISPFLFLFYRFLITVILLTPFYLRSKSKGINIRTFPTVIIGSFLASTATLGLLFYGTNLTTSLDSSLISATSPIAIILMGILFLKERVTKKEKLGILITLAGTVLIALQSVFERGKVASNGVFGNILIFASNITFAGSLFLAKRDLRNGVSPFSLMYFMFFIGLFTVFPLGYLESGDLDFTTKIFTLPLSAHLSVFYMAFLSGALAYYLYQKAQKTIETSEAAVFLYLQPLVTAPVGVLWLGEKLTSPYIIGSIIIAVGVILAEWKRPKFRV